MSETPIRHRPQEVRRAAQGFGRSHRPRGSLALLYRAQLDDDGTLERSLKGDTSFRARYLRACFLATKDPRLTIPRWSGLPTTRLEGKSVRKVQAIHLQPLRIILRATRFFQTSERESAAHSHASAAERGRRAQPGRTEAEGECSTGRMNDLIELTSTVPIRCGRPRCGPAL
jgi:hypothetical protein